MGAGGAWIDRGSGPVVRPYALTGGRTEPLGGEMLDLIATIVASRRVLPADDPIGVSPEHRRILGLCQRPVILADLASDLALPLGVVRVLLADLIAQGQITVLPQRPTGDQPSADLLKEVLHGLRAL